eukprot:403359260
MDYRRNLWVADKNANTIFYISKETSTWNAIFKVSGTDGTSGSRDGNIAKATFNSPTSICIYDANTTRITLMNNLKPVLLHTFSDFCKRDVNMTTYERCGKIIDDTYPNNTLDGSKIKYIPFVTLSPQEKNFSYSLNNEPRIVYIADRLNHCIRKLDISKAEVSTYAGICGKPGFKDGVFGSNLLYHPELVGVDADGILFIFDAGNKYIRMVETNQYMHTMIQGACKEDLNTIPPKIPFQLKLRPMICYKTWIKTSGQPEGHLVNSGITRSTECLDEHYVNCGSIPPRPLIISGLKQLKRQKSPQLINLSYYSAYHTFYKNFKIKQLQQSQKNAESGKWLIRRKVVLSNTLASQKIQSNNSTQMRHHRQHSLLSNIGGDSQHQIYANKLMNMQEQTLNNVRKRILLEEKCENSQVLDVNSQNEENLSSHQNIISYENLDVCKLKSQYSVNYMNQQLYMNHSGLPHNSQIQVREYMQKASQNYDYDIGAIKPNFPQSQNLHKRQMSLNESTTIQTQSSITINKAKDHSIQRQNQQYQLRNKTNQMGQLDSDLKKYQMLVKNGNKPQSTKMFQPLKSARLSMAVSTPRSNYDDLVETLKKQEIFPFQKNNFDLFQKQMLTKKELEKLILLNKLKKDGIVLGPFECQNKEELHVDGSKSKLKECQLSTVKDKKNSARNQSMEQIRQSQISLKEYDQQQLQKSPDNRKSKHSESVMAISNTKDSTSQYEQQSQHGKRVQSTQDSRIKESQRGRNNFITSETYEVQNEQIQKYNARMRNKRHSQTNNIEGEDQSSLLDKNQTQRSSQIFKQIRENNQINRNLTFKVNQQLFKNTLLQQKYNNVRVQSQSSETCNQDQLSKDHQSNSYILAGKTSKPFKSHQPISQLDFFNNSIDLLNNYIKLGIKNKNSLTPLEAIQFVKLSKTLKIHLNAIQKQSSNELNQYVKSREFLQQSRLKVQQFLNEQVCKLFSKESLNIIKGLETKVQVKEQLNAQNQAQNGSSGVSQNFKFYVDNTGNNHQLVKSLLKRRSWMTSVDTLKSNFDQVNIIWTQWKKQKILTQQKQTHIYGKIDGNHYLTNKYYLLDTMKNFYKDRNKDYSQIMPLTFRIDYQERSLNQNRNYQKFLKFFNKQEAIIQQQKLNILDTTTSEIQAQLDNLWILKPGENSNRGRGIVIMKKLSEIIQFLEEQKGEFTTDNLDNRLVHLTNDAIQKKAQDYGKFEIGNKISYEDFASFLAKEKFVNFNKEILPKIRDAVKDTMEAFGEILEQQFLELKNFNNFELFGYDFMIDENLNLKLIEVNTNPCLETQSCALLNRIITQVVDQTFKITVDPFCQGDESDYLNNHEYSMNEFKYELVYTKNLQSINKQEMQLNGDDIKFAEPKQ